MASKRQWMDRLTGQSNEGKYPFIYALLLIGILMLGAYFRFTGVNWDESQHLHPDERFLTMVASSITSVENLDDYFNTAVSTLNPHNMGYGFYVYGTLPLFLVRWAAEALHQTGYDEIFLVGRVLSGFADLLTVLLVYLTALRLFRRQRLALVAAAFMAFSVLPIQLSHYFTVDNFANLFTLLAIHFAVRVFTDDLPVVRDDEETHAFQWRDLILHWNSSVPYMLFGAGLGLALASKVSIAPLAALLPLAAVVYFFRLTPQQQGKFALVLMRNLVLGAIVSFIVFRIFQPYAFTGPGFFGIGLNQKWFDNLSSLQAQSSGDVDSPPELQWARRPLTFAWTNMVDWGLGLPLGILAWVGFIWMGLRILRGEWKTHLLLWLWTGAYFAWQALSFTRTMRYQIPVYPTLAIIAAWAIFALWDCRLKVKLRLPGSLAQNWSKVALLLGIVVLGSTFAWAFAFTRIYTRPMTRVEATRWIYQNVPGPINLHIQTETGQVNQPMAYLNDGSIEPDEPYVFTFSAPASGTMAEVTLPGLAIQSFDPSSATLLVKVTDVKLGNKLLASGTLLLATPSKDQTYTIPLDTLAEVKKGQVYGVAIQMQAGRGSALLTKDIPLRIYTRTNQTDVALNQINLQGVSSHTARFTATLGGSLRWLSFPVRAGGSGAAAAPAMISVTVMEPGAGGKVLASQTQTIEPAVEPHTLTFHFEPALALAPAREYLVIIDNTTAGQSITLNGMLNLRTVDDRVETVVPYPVRLIYPGNPYLAMADVKQDGILTEISFARLAQQDPAQAGAVDLSVDVLMMNKSDVVVASGKVITTLDPAGDTRGSALTVKLDRPLEVEKGSSYFIRLSNSKGAVALRGSAPANESTWDDGLPLRMDGYDGYSGIYQRDLNFEMYWDDNQDKLARFQRTLDSADYLFITSNRQWGTTTRVQERYPLTSTYYRNLLGCPDGKELTWCYSVVQPGMFEGQLGYELVKVFQSDPNLGDWKFNSQFAEEAYTVYDHPKVLIFQKKADYSAATVKEILGAVDLSKVIHVTPRKAGVPANLLLPEERLSGQQAGGTWSELFNRNLIFNQYPVLALILWYLAASLLGWACYPMVRLALGGLADKGFPLARLVGLLVLAYLAWLAGSVGLSFTQPTIWLAIALLVGINAALFWAQRDAILSEWQQKKRYFLMVEALALAFFVLFLLIRLGNPDLWHPAKGGEKPMDFSYFNAVLKSTTFPPYDPWFAGGYINYYYYGFVVAGVLVKALGIIPAVGYNLVLPAFFSMVAMGAFSIGWNLLSKGWRKGEESDVDEQQPLPREPWLAGLASSVGLLLLGNLGTVKMLWEGFQKMVVAEEVMNKADIFSRMGWMFQGIVKYFGGEALPYSMGEWYWNPSRAIPGDPITEFPFFTFLYGDPHAHLWALPITLLAVAWAVSILRTRWDWNEGRGRWWGGLRFALSLLLGGLAIGALRPMNTWDLPTYLVLGALALVVSAQPFKENWWKGLLSAVVLAGLAFLLFQPYAAWYGQGYNAIKLWEGDLTPEWAYTMHWGLFLFVIASWMAWETIDWMAKTPVSALNMVRQHLGYYIAAVVGTVAVIIGLLVMKIQPGWIVVLMGVWAVVLMLRRGQPLAKRAVLFMTGSALALTLAVELVVLVGDIGRMNTVFKFYLQAWTLFSLSAAAALMWLWPAVQSVWQDRVRAIWKVALAVLVIGAALYPLMAGTDKIRDRMSREAPITLDGMQYMATSKYSDQGVEMDLSQDFEAIRWMQDNVKGSPVIVEASVPEYRWGTRFTIYTGLPGVVGWNWHQRQQRAITPSEWVSDRVDEIGIFYRTTNLELAGQFLRLYNVRYIILGQLERAYFPGAGLAKFERENGNLWKEVFRTGDTVIYEVLE